MALTLCATGATAVAQSDSAARPNWPAPDDIIRVFPVRSPEQLLPDVLGGVKATGDRMSYSSAELGLLLGNRADVYREYHVICGVARTYGTVRVEVVQARDSFAAFGLFTYLSMGPAAEAVDEPGPRGAPAAEGRVFWQGNCLVYLRSAQAQRRLAQNTLDKMAASISGALGRAGPSKYPTLLDSVPRSLSPVGRLRYFLGPAAIAAYLDQNAQTFDFRGDAEAVLTQYEQAGSSQLRLLIVEFHTPQFAFDEMARARSYLASLPTDEQNRIVLKREGNYIVEAMSVIDREEADRLVNEIKYPYVVKWLRNPRLPTEDPFRGQKAAQILLSTFGILGLLLSSALLGGLAFGTAVFIKRRKEQREVFSDAGGMLRLEIEPMLGGAGSHHVLSPGREE
jgi:hypothetical protein